MGGGTTERASPTAQRGASPPRPPPPTAGRPRLRRIAARRRAGTRRPDARGKRSLSRGGPGSGQPEPRRGIGGGARKRWRRAGMCDLVARTGRHLQRYEDGRRLVAGCVRPHHNHSPTLCLLASPPPKKRIISPPSIRSGWVSPEAVVAWLGSYEVS